ncbi:hypothetical protein CVT24_007080 [Panaeolus cyanescens]|uniref:Rhodopsin domain-containing protein n=1 Tax=Panaeolus cyanescens TaxID=181874 RepID=A0A409YP30_9AGAR|nr:hypothetical protein CVT24_007080 [Panaeolus cyanescens]
MTGPVSTSEEPCGKNQDPHPWLSVYDKCRGLAAGGGNIDAPVKNACIRVGWAELGYFVPQKPSIVVVLMVFYLAGLWCARLSIAVTIVRMVNDNKSRIVAKLFAVFFGLCAVVLILLRIFNCGTKFDKPPICVTPRYAVYVDLVLDILADIWLIAAPLLMLFRSNLSQKHKRLIAGIIACGVFIALASVLHIAFLMTRELLMVAITAHVQTTVAIVVCNLLVLVTFAYQRFPVWFGRWGSSRREREIDGDAHAMGRIRGTSPAQTNVEGGCPSPPDGHREALNGEESAISHLSLTELGSSMLGGSSRDYPSFGVVTNASSGVRSQDRDDSRSS